MKKNNSMMEQMNDLYFEKLKEHVSKQFSSFRNVLIIAVDSDFNLILTNKAFQERAFDYNRIEVVNGSPLNKIIKGETDYKIVKGSFELALQGKSFSNVQKLGFEETRFYEVFYAPLYHNQSNIFGAILFARDLSNVAQDEKTIRNAEEQLKRMANVLNLGLALEEIIYSENGEPVDCRFKFINHQYEKFTGLSAKEVVGKLVSLVIPDAQDGSFWLDKYKNAIVTGETISFDHYAPYIKKWFNIVAYCPMQHRLALLLTDISERKQAEENIKRSEYLYRSTVDSLIAGVTVFDNQGIIISINPEAKRILGNQVEGLSLQHGNHGTQFYDENGNRINADELPIVQVMRMKKPIVDRVIGIFNQDSNYMVWANVSVTPLFDKTGVVERIIANFIEITDRKQMEDRIIEDKNALFIQKRQAEETLLAITEGVISTDARGNITNFNKVSEQITEWKREEVIGKRFDDVFHVVDSEHKLCESPIHTVLDQNYPITSHHKGRYTLISKLEHEYQIECSSAPIVNEDGILTGVVIVFRNITEELALTRRYIIERQRLERVVEASTDMLLEIDLDKIIVNISGKGLNKIGAEETSFIGKKITDVLTDSLDNHEYAHFQALSGNQYTYDWEYRMKNQVLWFESTVSPIYDENNKIVGAINIARETTERKQKQIEIEFLSTHDGLTQINNRHYFVQKMEMLDYPYHYPLGVFMLDMNGLKLINDVFGHQVGDEALKKIAFILKQSFRQEDVVARIGGDEFAIILPNTTQERMAQRKTLIQNRVAATSVENIPLSIAVGYAIKTTSDQKMDDIMKSAENSMYEDKSENNRPYHNLLLSSFQKNLYALYPEEQLHAEKTHEYAMRLVKELDITSEELRQLDLASQVHDIGKIFVPFPIYRKPDKLTLSEYQIVQKHVNHAYQMLKYAENYEFIADIVLHHHERWDGRGYPRGLKAGEIPPLARVLSIADGFAAMTRERPYHKKMTEADALQELKNGSGSQYDPQLVDRFISTFKK